MARRRTYAPLNIFLNSRHVGKLRREPSGAVDFQYTPAWLEWKHTFPMSLSLPLRPERYTGAPVLAVLENLLPDNDLILRRVADRVHADGIDAYSLLTAIGRDCVGALQFLPEDVDPGPAGAVAGEVISDSEIEAMLHDLARVPLGLTQNAEFRISIAGAQEKTALLFWKGKWHKPHGATATTHILKRPIGHGIAGIDLSDSVENEYLCLLLTAAFGLPTAKGEIVTFGSEKAFVIERFDRYWASDGRLLRIPQEDCCQALSIPPSRKYEADGGPGLATILQLLKGSDDPILDQRNFLKANVVFWLMGAIDGHAKNFSLSLGENGRFHLTPLYDIVSGQFAVDAGRIRHNAFKLAMSVGRKRHYVIDTVAPRHFIESASKAGVGETVVQSVFAEIREAIVEVNGVFEALPVGFPARVAEPIRRGIQRRIRLLET